MKIKHINISANDWIKSNNYCVVPFIRDNLSIILDIMVLCDIYNKKYENIHTLGYMLKKSNFKGRPDFFVFNLDTKKNYFLCEYKSLGDSIHLSQKLWFSFNSYMRYFNAIVLCVNDRTKTNEIETANKDWLCNYIDKFKYIIGIDIFKMYRNNQDFSYNGLEDPFNVNTLMKNHYIEKDDENKLNLIEEFSKILENKQEETQEEEEDLLSLI